MNPLASLTISLILWSSVVGVINLIKAILYFFKAEFNSFPSFTSVGKSTHITASTPASLIFFANFSIP